MLRYFDDSSGLGLILVPDDPLYTVAVEALIEAVSVGEDFAYDHRFAASDAFECAVSALVDQ